MQFLIRLSTRLLLAALIFPWCALLIGGALELACRVFPRSFDCAADYIGLNVLLSLIGSIALATKIPLRRNASPLTDPEVLKSILQDSHRAATTKIDVATPAVVTLQLPGSMPKDETTYGSAPYSWTSGDDDSLAALGVIFFGLAYVIWQVNFPDSVRSGGDWFFFILVELIFGGMGVLCFGFRVVFMVNSLERQLIRKRSFLGMSLSRQHWDFASLSRVELRLSLGVKGSRYWTLVIAQRSGSDPIVAKSYFVGSEEAFEDARKLAQVLGLPSVERLK